MYVEKKKILWKVLEIEFQMFQHILLTYNEI